MWKFSHFVCTIYSLNSKSSFDSWVLHPVHSGLWRRYRWVPLKQKKQYKVQVWFRRILNWAWSLTQERHSFDFRRLQINSSTFGFTESSLTSAIFFQYKRIGNSRCPLCAVPNLLSWASIDQDRNNYESIQNAERSMRIKDRAGRAELTSIGAIPFHTVCHPLNSNLF